MGNGRRGRGNDTFVGTCSDATTDATTDASTAVWVRGTNALLGMMQ